MVVFPDEVAKMASTNQFFNLVLECFAFICGMAIVTVIATVFDYVGVGRVGCFASGGMRSSRRASSRRRDL